MADQVGWGGSGAGPDATSKARTEQDRAELASGRVIVLESELDRVQRQADAEVRAPFPPLSHGHRIGTSSCASPHAQMARLEATLRSTTEEKDRLMEQVQSLQVQRLPMGPRRTAGSSSTLTWTGWGNGMVRMRQTRCKRSLLSGRGERNRTWWRCRRCRPS